MTNLGAYGGLLEIIRRLKLITAEEDNDLWNTYRTLGYKHER